MKRLIIDEDHKYRLISNAGIAHILIEHIKTEHTTIAILVGYNRDFFLVVDINGLYTIKPSDLPGNNLSDKEYIVELKKELAKCGVTLKEFKEEQ